MIGRQADMKELFDTFPYLEGGRLAIRKMDGQDLDALSETIDNGNIYRFILPFLYIKSRDCLLAASATRAERILKRGNGSSRACT